MSKKTAFQKYLDEPQLFSDWSWVINAEISKEKFYEMIKQEDNEILIETTLEDFLKVVTTDYVSWRWWLDEDYEWKNMWWLWANPTSTRSHKVWTY